MSFDIRQDPLFVGLGTSAVCYYRVMLPAMFLGCDWTGVKGEPPNLGWATGLTRGNSALPKFDDYKVIVLQQPNAPGWFEVIERAQKRGTKVLFEVDDYVHGVQKQKSHDFRRVFDKKYLGRFEALMRACDGVIASTEFIAKRYRKFNPNVYVCENGLDLSRYNLERPKHETVNIGWAGATGHLEGMQPWLQQVYYVMVLRENTTFISVGQPFAKALVKGVGEERALTVPFCQIEQYPGAMTMFDIALGPAGKGSFFQGKSDLRWLEAGALGIPIIASPRVYPKIKHRKTGFHASNPMLMAAMLTELIDNEELRTEIGENARTYVREERSMERMAQRWAEVLEAVVD